MRPGGITALEVLLEEPGEELALPRELARLYGPLRLDRPGGRPLVWANFVASLDGAVTLDVPGHLGGDDVSGHSATDRMVMGLLRAVADAVVVGAGTLRAAGDPVYTAADAYPPFAGPYGELRRSLGKREPPLNVVVSASGELDPGLRLFRSGEVPALVVTTARGAARLRESALPAHVQVAALEAERWVGARAMLSAVERARRSEIVLVEGGPHLIGVLLEEAALDELFLTIAPQVIGRDDGGARPAFAAGRRFAPDRPRWASLRSLRRSDSLLFTRYRFLAPPPRSAARR